MSDTKQGSTPIAQDVLEFCPACGGEAARAAHAWSKHGREVNRCNSCGLLFVNPRPRQEEISAIYTKDYFQAGGFDEYGYRDYEKMLALKEWTFRRWLEDLSQIQSPGTLLEIGCATGLMLQLARDAGWDVTGVELSTYAAEQAAARNVTVHNCALDDAPLTPGSFDVVLMLDLIEHVPDPLSLLKSAARFLKPGGCVYIITPNAGSLSARLQGKSWPHMKPKEHLCLFTKQAMRALMARAGFEPLRVAQSRKVMTFDHLIKELADVNPMTSSGLKAVCAVVPGLRARQFYLPLGEMCAVGRKP